MSSGRAIPVIEHLINVQKETMRQLLTLGTKISIGFLLAVVLLAVISVIAYRNTQTLIETDRWVVHTHEVLTTLEVTLSQLKDAETGQRGYVITGNEQYLEPYQAARRELPQRIARLRILTMDNPSQQQHLGSVAQHQYLGLQHHWFYH